MRLIDQNVNEFVQTVASDAPAPGGGSVAALSSTLGAGLLIMAIRISAKKQPDAQLETQRPLLEKEKNRLLELVDEDTEAFNQVMAAFGMPKNTEQEKENRNQKIQEAFKRAASVPLETMQCSLRVLQAGNTVAQKCNPNVASDVGTGIQMAYAGLQGAKYNVAINLATIKDEKVKENLRKSSEKLKSQGHEAFQEALDFLNEKLTA